MYLFLHSSFYYLNVPLTRVRCRLLSPCSIINIKAERIKFRKSNFVGILMGEEVRMFQREQDLDCWNMVERCLLPDYINTLTIIIPARCKVHMIVLLKFSRSLFPRSKVIIGISIAF